MLVIDSHIREKTRSFRESIDLQKILPFTMDLSCDLFYTLSISSARAITSCPGLSTLPMGDSLLDKRRYDAVRTICEDSEEKGCDCRRWCCRNGISIRNISTTYSF